MAEIRTSQKPHRSLLKVMSTVYMMPRQTTDPVNILVIGMEKPMDACIAISEVLEWI